METQGAVGAMTAAGRVQALRIAGGGNNETRILVSHGATRVKIETSVAISSGRPGCERPPCPAYSPSEFSRTITQSSSGPATLRKGL